MPELMFARNREKAVDKLARQNGGILMKEEILERSRRENEKPDEGERDALAQAEGWHYPKYGKLISTES